MALINLIKSHQVFMTLIL